MKEHPEVKETVDQAALKIILDNMSDTLDEIGGDMNP